MLKKYDWERGTLIYNRNGPLLMAIGAGWPTRIVASGGHYIDAEVENHDQVNINAQLEAGHTMVIAGATNNQTGLETLIRGQKANIDLNGPHCTVRPEPRFAEEIDPFEIKSEDIGDPQNALRLDWLRSIRTREPNRSQIDLATLVARAAADGASSVLVSGSTGEGALLEADERVRITRRARAVLDAGPGTTTLVAGATGPTVTALQADPTLARVVADSRAGLVEMHRVLAPGGLLMFSTFGPDTLKELRAAYEGTDRHVHVNRFIDMHDLGDMLLRDVEAQRAFLQSTLGNVEYAGRFQRTGRYQIATHGGNIRVITPGTPGFDLEAMTYRGDVRSDFPFRVVQKPEPAARGPRPRGVLRGAVGDAGASVNLSSFGGNPLLISPDRLVEDGLLNRSELAVPGSQPNLFEKAAKSLTRPSPSPQTFAPSPAKTRAPPSQQLASAAEIPMRFPGL